MTTLKNKEFVSVSDVTRINERNRSRRTLSRDAQSSHSFATKQEGKYVVIRAKGKHVDRVSDNGEHVIIGKNDEHVVRAYDNGEYVIKGEMIRPGIRGRRLHGTVEVRFQKKRSTFNRKTINDTWEKVILKNGTKI